MNIVLLADTIGSGMWPLATSKIPKQFIKILKNNNSYESMLQRIYRQITKVFSGSKVYITASKKYISLIKKQIGKNVNLIVEPAFKNVSMSVIYSILYLENKGINAGSIVFLPLDFYSSLDFYSNIRKISKLVDKYNYILCILGIEKSEAMDKYRYLICDEGKIKSFVENSNSGRDILKMGGVVNSGIMAYNMSQILDVIKNRLSIKSIEEMKKRIDDIENLCLYRKIKESFGFEIACVKSKDDWEDIGSWKKIVNYIPNELFDNNRVFKIMECDTKNITNTVNIDISNRQVLSIAKDSINYIVID